MNKDSVAKISGPKSQRISSNKANATLEKNHRDQEIKPRKVREDLEKSKHKYQIEIEAA